MKGRAIDSRAKGSSGEREFARLVLAETGVKLERKLDQTRGGGHDLDPVGDCPVAKALGRFAIECKRYAAVTPAMLARFWLQAEAQAVRAGRIPCLALPGRPAGLARLCAPERGKRTGVWRLAGLRLDGDNIC